MRPTYPLIGAYIEPQEPEPTVVRQRATSGRIRTYDLGSYSDHEVTLTHSMIKSPTVAEVMAFWRENTGRMFNIEDGLGESWVAGFLGRPHRIHQGGPWYDLIVKVVRYDPTEGGL